MIIKLREQDSRYPDLTSDQPYLVLGIEADDFRILNDQGRPYLYPRELFTVVDAREPADWVNERGEDNERYAYPPPLSSTGFFEDYFDGKPEAVATFWRVMNQRLSAAA
ncbi:MAG TPA: hypothetical protein VEW48_10370 [Thermoanaerobaculia bacterium]|nr:hypothetical protein [Thermoanaerobaculia bacterium]